MISRIAQAWWTNVHGFNGFLVKAFFGFDYNDFLIIIVHINAFLGKSYSGIVGVSVELSFRWNFKKSREDIKKRQREKGRWNFKKSRVDIKKRQR